MASDFKGERLASMRTKRPYPTTFDKVRVTRDGDYADIQYLDDEGCGVHFGPIPKDWTDEQVFKRHNDGLLATRAMRLRHPYFAREIPAGKPQIRRERQSAYWNLVGDVLRGGIDAGDHPEDLIFEVDDEDLSLNEFASLFLGLGGWGFRLVVVPADEILRHPRIKVGGEPFRHRDPGEETEDLKDSRFTGNWRITKMEAVEPLGPAHIKFDRHGGGGIRFAEVKAKLGCCQYASREGRPSVDFSWAGTNDGDRGNGRGWALIREDGTLEGRFLIQGGDASAFWARKESSAAGPEAGRGRREGTRA